MSSDSTKELLEQILAQLHSEQAREATTNDGSYLQAQDGQLLGKLNANQYNQESILNQYGPFGSQYSNTSIFNKYSPYGSEYGAYSINNPYCSVPPKLFINGVFRFYVSANPYVTPKISPDSFLYTLQSNPAAAARGEFVENEAEARQQRGESFIQAQDGVFLGRLTPSQFDSESIFNKFGPYGNKFSQTSFLNKFSPYGQQFSHLSAYNSMASSPPKIFHKGQFLAYLTKNIRLSSRIDPDEIFEWASENVSRFNN
ncbi:MULTISPECIES: hypothetical protein [Halomonadaceae]|uniref:hypothetical protein n=1 Tax=Halomonadaceae TaxID=28256 RepID=UPI0012EEE49C|nr:MULTISPECIES: hypothetical protein [Halomonas]CAD5267978.1 conserved hypothetical protein [Halomonas sp. I3]CAD5273712.1 conserved hypothetical protein [Halomonas sp. 113]CAD5275330.1 conserved hypothetical protein [Halomonas sp. 59]CAD5278268.1 conserved hypothetical protein [Halomonas sp. 156]VXB93035.1 conserved hypothetical protein [Halomonas titanicae]